MKIRITILALIVTAFWMHSSGVFAQGLIGDTPCFRCQYYEPEPEYAVSMREWISMFATSIVVVGISFLRIPGPKPEIVRLYFDLLAVLIVPVMVNIFVSWLIYTFGPLGGGGL